MNAGLDGAPHAFGAVGVGGHAHAVVGGGPDDRLELVHPELRIVTAGGHAEHAAGGGDLDQVGAVLVALPHRRPRLGDAVEHAFARTRIAGQVEAPAVGRIGVPAGGRQGLGRSEDARTGNPPGVDCIAKGEGGVEGIAQITHRGETGLDGLAGVLRAAQGHVRFIERETLDVGRRAHLAGQMGVHVHQARQAGQRRQVDALDVPGPGRMPLPQLGDLAVGKNQGMRAEPLTGIDVDHAPATHPGLPERKPGTAQNSEQNHQSNQLKSSRKTENCITLKPETRNSTPQTIHPAISIRLSTTSQSTSILQANW